MRRFILIVLCSLTAGAVVGRLARADDPPATLSELREWKSSDGAYSTRAVLLEITADSVRLRNAENAEVVVPLARLSREDQAFVQGLRKARSTTAGTDQPTEYQKATIELEAAVMNLIAALIEKETTGVGKALQFELDIAKEHLAAEQLSIAEFRAADCELRVAKLRLEVAELEAAQQGKPVEKAWMDRLRQQDPEYIGAKKALAAAIALREAAVAKAKEGGMNLLTELEQATEKIDADLTTNAEYQSLAKRWMELHAGKPAPDGRTTPLGSPVYRAAWLRYELKLKN